MNIMKTTTNPIGTIIILDTPANFEGRPYEVLVTFPVNGHYRPTFARNQSEGRTGEFYAGWRRFAVVSRFPELVDASPVTHHGNWLSLDEAQRFASSMGRGDKAQAVEVAPYLYQPAFGRVGAMHE